MLQPVLFGFKREGSPSERAGLLQLERVGYFDDGCVGVVACADYCFERSPRLLKRQFALDRLVPLV